jgi:hypothetical protein
LKPDSLAICDGQSWSGAYQTESQSWYLSTNSKSPLLSNPQLLSSEKSFKITSDFIKSNSGKFLVCAAKAENNGFTTTTTVVRQIIAPAAPILYGVFISVNSYQEGALATCDFKASTDESDQKVFEWGYGDKSTFTPITGSNNNSLKISGDLIRSAAGQFLSCRLTLTNLGGNTSSTGYSSERFPSAPTDLSYKVYNSGGWTEGAYMVCDGSQTSTSKMLSVQKSWGITDANGNGFIGAPISTSDRLFVSNDLLINIAGKTLGCLVNATNAIGSTQRIFTTQIPISVAPSLPVPGNLTISKQEALTSSITVTITIPSFSSFSSSTMDARLRFSNTSCDNMQITTFPTTITCKELPAKTAFAPYLTVGYVANSGIAQSRSGSTAFTTVGLTPAVEMPTCSRYKTIVIYGPLPTYDSSKTNFSLQAIYDVNGPRRSVTSTGFNLQGGRWNVDFIDLNDMASYTIRVVRSDQGVETFANCIETQNAPSDIAAPQVGVNVSNDPQYLYQYSPVAPTSISVGQNVTATFRLSDDIGITSCGATVYNVNNVDTTTNTVCTKISGTPSDGIWQVTLNLNSSNNPGAYTIKAFGTDASGKTSTRVQIGTFTIVGPSVSNLTTMPTLQTIGINYVDQIVLNGINFGSISPNSPGSYAWTVRVTNSAGTIITTVPTGSNQTYITGLTGSTTYKVYLVATDSSGATKLSNALTVTTLAPASASDSIKPVVVDGSSEMVSGWTMKIGMTPTLSLIATDNVGVENVTVTLIANNLTVGTFNASLFSGTKANGVWRVQLSFTGSTFVGNWKVSAIATDAAGNQSTQILLREIPVSAATITDSQNPVVVVGSGVLTTSTLPSSGGTVAVTYRVTDDVGCCSYHQAWMYYPNGTVVQQVTPALISGDEKNGTFRASFNVPSGAVAGSYQIKAQALDIAGKYTDLQLLGTVTVSAPAPLIPTDIYITSDQNFKSELSYPFRAALAQNSGPIAGVTITFWIDGVARTAVTDSSGVAIWTQNSHTSGKTSYSVYATYGGSATLAASTSPTRVITKYVAPTDSQNPVVVVGSGVLTTSSLETSGGTVAVTYRITDDVGCCGYHQAWMYYPNGTVVQQVTPALISGDEKNGTFRASFNVPSGVVAGSYQIKAQATDLAGKYTNLQLLGTVTVSAPAPLQIVSSSLQSTLYGSQNRIVNSFRVISGAPVSSVGISYKNSQNQNVGGGPIQNYRVSGSATDGVYQDNSIMSGSLWFPDGKTSEVISVYATASNANGESVPSLLLGTFTATSPCPGYRAYLPANQSVALCMFNNHYYGVVTGSYTWDAARALANSYNYAGSNGYLAHITSTEERNFITSLVTAGTSYWIGATDSPAEGCWRWVDGPASETGAAFLQKAGAVCEIPVVPGYNGFASNQPDDWGSGEDHASLWGGPEWNDANNTINPYPFVFEIGN